jgi:hypothetical protein
MTSTTDQMKWRVLVNYGAVIWQDGAWVPVHHVRYTGKPTARTKINAARLAGCQVKCACGCGVWASMGEIEFDHQQARINGGATTISWLQPLRRDPCHRAKTRIDLKIRDKVARIREKFFGSSKPKRSWGYRPIASRPFQVINGGRA